MTRITQAEVRPGSTAASFGMAEPLAVIATFDDGTTKEVFEFYSDELRFSGTDFVGLTEAEARELHRQRDTAWLQS